MEGVELRTGRMFTPEDIEGGILEDILIESDYDVLRVVSVTFLHLRTCMFLCLDPLSNVLFPTFYCIYHLLGF